MAAMALPPVRVACPWDRDHRVPPDALPAHVRRCTARLCPPADPVRPARAPPSSQPFYRAAPAVVTCLLRPAPPPPRVTGTRPRTPDLHHVLYLDDGADEGSSSSELVLYDRVCAVSHQLRATEAVPVPPAAVPSRYERELAIIRQARSTRARGCIRPPPVAESALMSLWQSRASSAAAAGPPKSSWPLLPTPSGGVPRTGPRTCASLSGPPRRHVPALCIVRARP
jgi:hypothetical protein